MKVPITPHHLEYRYYAPPPIIIALGSFSHCILASADASGYSEGPRQNNCKTAADAVDAADDTEVSRKNPNNNHEDCSVPNTWSPLTPGNGWCDSNAQSCM